MHVPNRSKILVFQDKIGVLGGYNRAWNKLLLESGIVDSRHQVILRSTYSRFPGVSLLEFSKQRKQPGWIKDVSRRRGLSDWIKEEVARIQPDIVVVQDIALLYFVNPHWDEGTLDRLRGGVYPISLAGVHDSIWVVTLPMHAMNSKMKSSDIAKLNEGFVEKSDWEEFRNSEELNGPDEDDSESQMEWHEPIVVPYGKFVLEMDYAKIGRIAEKCRLQKDRSAGLQRIATTPSSSS